MHSGPTAAHASLPDRPFSASQVAEEVNAVSSNAKIANQMKTMMSGQVVRPSSRKRGQTIGMAVPARATNEFQPTERRSQFLVGSGQELARLLNADLVRLDTILKRISPYSQADTRSIDA